MTRRTQIGAVVFAALVIGGPPAWALSQDGTPEVGGGDATDLAAGQALQRARDHLAERYAGGWIERDSSSRMIIRVVVSAVELTMEDRTRLGQLATVPISVVEAKYSRAQLVAFHHTASTLLSDLDWRGTVGLDTKRNGLKVSGQALPPDTTAALAASIPRDALHIEVSDRRHSLRPQNRPEQPRSRRFMYALLGIAVAAFMWVRETPDGPGSAHAS